ncbi:DNA adenine methylase, partial [Leuconostoc mesenteroides]|uniref:DNA adenine methylase n=1 Tax=Leuconostoc mesenteroides TaxID=1245 RepID=UPI001CBC735B
MKGDGKKLQEVIIYFKKDMTINKSPLNYAGSKNDVIPKIFKLLPKHVTTFVDAMGGAFNVGANATALTKVVYNEYNPFVFEMIKMIVDTPANELIKNVEQVINKFSLKKKEKQAYECLRNYYNNEEQTAINLYTLNIYSFQNILRFNQAKKYNTPIGNNEFNEGYRNRITNFIPRVAEIEMNLGSYSEIDFTKFDDYTVFYFDPPYLVTTAGYNDGKRGFDGWDAEQEANLLKYLTELDLAGKRFMLSNV